MRQSCPDQRLLMLIPYQICLVADGGRPRSIGRCLPCLYNKDKEVLFRFSVATTQIYTPFVDCISSTTMVNSRMLPDVYFPIRQQCIAVFGLVETERFFLNEHTTKSE
jgi:hypothetical protein